MAALLFASPILADLAASAAETPSPPPAPNARQTIVRSAKLLTIGNSFADNATAYLPGIAKAEGKELTIFRANLDGTSMQDHVAHLKAFEANPNDPKGSPYLSLPDPVTGKRRYISLHDVLESDRWTYVTIQQVSSMSYRRETYEPAAGVLIAYIHKHAPQAEILVHQTWAYRGDGNVFADGKLTPEAMYQQLRSAYNELAEDYDLRIIPCGDAFYSARKTLRWTFKFPDPNFDYQHPEPGQLPDQTGSLYNGWMWTRDGGKPRLRLDARHANPAGRYLGAAVFYEILYKQPPSRAFCPSILQPEDTETLRAVAHASVLASKRKAPSQLTGTAEKPRKSPE
ncbi:MAG TPA: DUF4886 domain-containing protein [Chthoniobacterales bacterium]